jgi:predicted secreted protein
VPVLRSSTEFAVMLTVCLFAACVTTPDAIDETQPPADVRITASQAGSIVEIVRGRTFSIERPANFTEWRVDFSEDVVTMLTSASERRSPGAGGWRFRAAAAGDTDITITPLTTGAAPPSFVFTIKVKEQ